MRQHRLQGLQGALFLVAAVATLRRPDVGAKASAPAGAVMMDRIVGEALMLNQPVALSPSEAVYFTVGLAMAALGLALGRDDQKMIKSAGRVQSTSG